MNFAPMSDREIRRAYHAPLLTPTKRRDRVTEWTIVFWLGFSTASVLYTVAGLVYFLV